MPAIGSWFRQMVLRGLSATLPRRSFMVRGSRKSNAVSLTFDDGPHPEYTPKLLDLLQTEQIHATFFLIGQEAEKYPEIVQRMVGEGHDIGNHTYSHRSRYEIRFSEMVEEIEQCGQVLSKITGFAPTLFRPPRGKVTAKDLWWMYRNRYTVALWNVDPKDYSKQSSEEVLQWFRNWSLRGGDIILLHDKHPHAIDALPEMIATIRNQRLSFTTLRHWTS